MPGNPQETRYRTQGSGIVAARLSALLLASLLLIACGAMPSLVKPRLEEEGQIFVYLKPISQEADRLTFRLEGISAVRADGGRIPVSLHIQEIDSRQVNRERLLASGNFPPGQYLGFSIAASGATLRGEEGKIALPLADEKIILPFPFSITKKKALVVSLEFRYKESLPDGIRFAPSFAAEIPEKIPTGRIGLISSRGGNTVTLFDKLTGRVVSVVPTGASPAGMALNPVLFRAYVAISGEDAVETIDLLGGDVIDRGRLTIGDRPEELAIMPDRKTILSANAGSNTVSVIDVASLVETARIRVGAGPQSVLVDRAGRRAYVFNTISGTVSVIDIARMAVVATVATEGGPVQGEFNRTGNRLYILHRFSPYLTVLDPATLSVVNRVYVGNGGTAIKVDPRTDLIYLARKGSGEVSIYDPFAFLPVDAYRIAGDASHLSIDGENNNLFIVLPGMGRVKTVRLVGKETVSETEVEGDPYWVALIGER